MRRTLEGSLLDLRRNVWHPHFELRDRADTEIDLRALQASVAQPKRYFPDVTRGFQGMQGAGMSQTLRGDVLARDGRHLSGGGACMECQALREAVPSDANVPGIEKEVPVLD